MLAGTPRTPLDKPTTSPTGVDTFHGKCGVEVLLQYYYYYWGFSVGGAACPRAQTACRPRTEEVEVGGTAAPQQVDVITAGIDDLSVDSGRFGRSRSRCRPVPILKTTASIDKYRKSRSVDIGRCRSPAPRVERGATGGGCAAGGGLSGVPAGGGAAAPGRVAAESGGIRGGVARGGAPAESGAQPELRRCWLAGLPCDHRAAESSVSGP